jgi:stearoyl-CoA desaturase (delta-9 desaturase)
MFQHNNYIVLALSSGVVLPMLTAVLLGGDLMGGYFYSAMLKIFWVHTSTFFVNSLAHWDGIAKLTGVSNLLTGYQPYSLTDSTAQDNIFVSFLALGEGLHNFHHSFDAHYANGPLWYNLDTTKWLILALEFLGLVKDVVRVPVVVIERSRANVSVQLAQRELDAVPSADAAGRRAAEEKLKVAQAQLAELDKRMAPVASTMTMEQMREQVRVHGRKLFVVGDYVVDIEKPIVDEARANKTIDFTRFHPGGVRLLDAYVGTDATEAMTGKVHKHSEGAMNMVLTLRVANLVK